MYIIYSFNASIVAGFRFSLTLFFSFISSFSNFSLLLSCVSPSGSTSIINPCLLRPPHTSHSPALSSPPLSFHLRGNLYDPPFNLVILNNPPSTSSFLQHLFILCLTFISPFFHLLTHSAPATQLVLSLVKQQFAPFSRIYYICQTTAVLLPLIAPSPVALLLFWPFFLVQVLGFHCSMFNINVILWWFGKAAHK